MRQRIAGGLKDLTDEELEAELANRKKAKLEPPTPLANPDFTALIAMVVEGVKECIEKEYEDDDFKQYVYEAAMEAVYGKSYWTWRNKQKW